MTSFTIPDLDDEVKNRLRARAARNGRSMEDEARSLLHEAVAGEPDSKNLATIIRECFEPYGGMDLELPPREPAREPPMFD